MLPFNMLHIVSYRAIVTLSLRRAVFTIFIFKQFHDLEIFMYSAIKIRANGDLLYSMLKPDTSSESPSAKSNGVRCVSANIEINQAMITQGH